MKVKVRVPTEPICTIKLEIDEAKALLAGMAGYEDVLAPREAIQGTNEMLKQALAKELKVDLEPSLFEATEGLINDAKKGKKSKEEEPPKNEGEAE